MEYTKMLLSVVKSEHGKLGRLSSRPILLMVSGGTDSALLPKLFTMADLDVPLHVFHVNYGLRGPDSDGDEEHVVSMCRGLGLEYTVHRVISMSLRNMEKEARDIRYEFVKKNFTNHIKVTAHHIEDQVETVIMRLARGCSVYGYSGIDRLRKDLVWRPFLEIPKAVITGASAELDVMARTDATNFDQSITRNWIRHNYMPNTVDDVCSESLLRLSESCKLLRDAVDGILDPFLEYIDTSHGSISMNYNNIGVSILNDDLISKRLRDRVWNMANLKPPNDEQYSALMRAVHKSKRGKTAMGKQVATWEGGLLEIKIAY